MEQVSLLVHSELDAQLHSSRAAAAAGSAEEMLSEESELHTLSDVAGSSSLSGGNKPTCSEAAKMQGKKTKTVSTKVCRERSQMNKITEQLCNGIQFSVPSALG